MSGGDPKLSIADTVPHISEEQARAALSVIHSQPRHEWTEFARMLGLTGEAGHVSSRPLGGSGGAGKSHR